MPPAAPNAGSLKSPITLEQDMGLDPVAHFSALTEESSKESVS
jgi:hypothetical protein